MNHTDQTHTPAGQEKATPQEEHEGEDRGPAN